MTRVGSLSTATGVRCLGKEDGSETGSRLFNKQQQLGVTSLFFSFHQLTLFKSRVFCGHTPHTLDACLGHLHTELVLGVGSEVVDQHVRRCTLLFSRAVSTGSWRVRHRVLATVGDALVATERRVCPGEDDGGGGEGGCFHSDGRVQHRRWFCEANTPKSTSS